MFAIEALAIGDGVQDVEVGPCDGIEDRIDVVEQPRSLCSEVPFLGMNRSLIFALSLRLGCFLRNACSAFVRVTFTRTSPALPALPLPFEMPLPVASSLPAEGTLTTIVAFVPLTPLSRPT